MSGLTAGAGYFRLRDHLRQRRLQRCQPGDSGAVRGKTRQYPRDRQGKRRRGLARNAGLSSAQGDFIWFVDADDFLLPNILGFLKDKAAETACDRLIVGGYQFTDRLTDEEIALSRQMKLPINSQWYDSVVWRSLLRREFLLENGLNFRYPELTHGEDGLYMYEVGLCAPKSVEIKLALYCYREHSGSAETTVSLENYHKKIRSYIRISEILLGYYRDGRQDPTTADKLMVFLWFTLYVTASLPRKDAAAVLRQLRQKGLYPFHRPPQCTLTRAYMTRQTGCVGTFLDWLCRHLHTRWGFSLMWLLQRPVQWKRLLAARAKNA